MTTLDLLQNAPPVSATSGRGAYRLGVGLTVGVLLVAVVGPFLAPYGPSDLGGVPFSGPSPEHLLGTDYLGQDILSRVLAGGWRLILTATALTVTAYLIGLVVGIASALTRAKWADSLAMRSVDVFIAIPPLLFLLILAAALGGGYPVIIIGTILLHIPSVARTMRSATLAIAQHGYVEAAFARGDSLLRIIQRQIMPNLVRPIVADGGPRITFSVFLIAALNYLGLGVPPGLPDWAGMISENRAGLGLQPLGVLAPALMIVWLSVAVNVLADAYSARLEQ